MSGEVLGFAIVAVFTLGAVGGWWALVRDVRRREFRVYRTSVTPARYPVSFWIGMLFQAAVLALYTYGVATMIWIPMLQSLLPK